MEGNSLPLSAAWFVVLPDHEKSRPIASALRDMVGNPTELSHPSGRPWIIGHWPSKHAIVARAQHSQVVAIGEAGIDEGDLLSLTSAVETVDDLDSVAEKIAGNVYLIASVSGQVRVQGSLSGLRRIFYSVTGKMPLASNRSDIVAHLLNKGVDETRLATRALGLAPPWPLSWQSVWRSVHALYPHRYLVLRGDGGHHEARWWSPPEPSLSVTEGAKKLRDALYTAVDIRTRSGGLVTCDLSGLDSSSLCSLAAASGSRVVAFTASTPDPMDDDVRWAQRTAEELSLSEHEVLPFDTRHLPYANLDPSEDSFDEPFPAFFNRSVFGALMKRVSSRRSTVHLWGSGGDEIATSLPSYLHPLFRTSPFAALNLARGMSAKHRIPLWKIIGSAFENQSYRAWLTGASKSLQNGHRHEFQSLEMKWGPALYRASWITDECIEATRSALSSAARTDKPLSLNRGEHATLHYTYLGASIARQFAQMASRYKVRLSAPFYDNQVIEAALSVEPIEKLALWRYKALLAESMEGIVPHATLNRSTKSETSAAIEIGMREHRGQVLALFENSRLAELGIIDEQKLRNACSRPFSDHRDEVALEAAIAAEAWLQTNRSGPKEAFKKARP